MKRVVRLFILLAALLPSTVSRAQNYVVSTTEGAVMEYVSFGEDGEQYDRILKTVESVSATARGTEVILSTVFLNDEGNPDEEIPVMRETVLITQNNITKLKEGTMEFFTEMMYKSIEKSDGTKATGENIQDADLTIDLRNVDITMEGDDVVYPLYPQAGQKLANATVTFGIEYRNRKGKEKSMKIMTVSSSGSIIGTETITTEAGTFECVKISKTVKMKVLLGIISETQRMISWYAHGVGEVMTQEVTKKGQIESTTRLVSVTNP